MTETGRSTDADDPPLVLTGDVAGPSPRSGATPPEGRSVGAARRGGVPATATPPLAPEDAAALATICRWIGPALLAYVVVAVAMIVVAVRRGRPVDAVLLATTVAISVGPILGYRSQARARLAGLRPPADTPPGAPTPQRPSSAAGIVGKTVGDD